MTFGSWKGWKGIFEEKGQVKRLKEQNGQIGKMIMFGASVLLMKEDLEEIGKEI